MCVVDRRVADGERAAFGVDHRVGTYLAGLQRNGDRERLHRRARFEHVGQRAITHPLARRLVARVRVVGRQIRERENLAATGVDDHEPAGLRLVPLDGCVQLAKREVLKPRIDRQREIAAGLRRAHRCNVLDDVAAPIDDDAAAAALAAQPFLLRELHAFLAAVLIAGETDDLRRHLPAGVIPAVFGFFIQSLDLERHRSRGCFGRDLPREHGEILAAGGHPRR